MQSTTKNTKHGDEVPQKISYSQHITKDEVRQTVTKAFGQHNDMLTVVKKRKLRWYGHAIRASGLAKTILQGTEQGGRKKRETEKGGRTFKNGLA